MALLTIAIVTGTVGLLLKTKRKTNRRKNKETRVLAPTKESQQEKRNVYLSAITVASASAGLFLPVLKPITIGLTLALSVPVISAAYQQLKTQGKLGHAALVSVLTGIGLYSGQLLGLSIALLFYHYGRKNLSLTQRQSKAMLVDLFSQKPETVWLLHNDVELETNLEAVSVGDCIIVNTGDPIPVDGIVIDGVASVDQQSLTGESQPAEKTVGQAVLASTQVVSGRLVIQVEKTGSDTVISQIGDMLNRTADYKLSMLSQGEQLADKVATPLMIGSVICSPLVGLVGVTGILNSSFGNRLQLAAPLAVLNHLNLASQNGILIKDGRALETLVKVDTILFDKTGTLTEEQPSVGQIFVCAEDYTEQRLLAEAAAAEQKLAHPIASAIVAKSQASALALPNIDDADFQIGLGVSVTINEAIIRVGSLRFMQEHQISIPDTLQAQLEVAYQQGHSAVFLAAGNDLKGALEIKPTIRPEIASLIPALRQRGIKHLGIVSGDHKTPTLALSKQLGMDHSFAEVMPEDKASIVKQLQAKGQTVCFIGDGVNDAMAIRQADVSISLDGATSIARDLAQVVFMDDGLSRLNELFDIAESLERTLQNTLKTLYTPVFINLAGTLLFGFGLLTTVLVNNASLLMALKKTKQHTLPKETGNSS